MDLAQYDLETAKAMNQTKRYLYVGFMCHQAMEKILKAYYASRFEDAPPYTHNLRLLAQKAGLYSVLSEEQKNFLEFLEPLNIESRYPAQKDKLLDFLTGSKCTEIIQKTESELQWIMKTL
ncbi:MAG: HEPN domain-containing protein [Phycisphaerae bacterium]|nr:HEPN domain-containing protein [Phycisphaerae bacterium]